MADTNLIRLDTTTHTYTNTSNGSNVGDCANSNSIDENFSTYQGHSYSAEGSSVPRTLISVSEHTFSRPMTLNQIKYRFACSTYTYGDYIRERTVHLYVEYYNGSWNELPGSHYYEYGGGNGTTAYDSGTVTYSTQITNVSAIRAHVAGYSYASGGHPSQEQVYVYIYEIEAFGPRFMDIGLRVKDTSGIQIIGTEELLASHALRVHKSGTTYGIPLLSTTDVDASAVRIQKGGTIYSLPKIS